MRNILIAVWVALLAGCGDRVPTTSTPTPIPAADPCEHMTGLSVSLDLFEVDRDAGWPFADCTTTRPVTFDVMQPGDECPVSTLGPDYGADSCQLRLGCVSSNVVADASSPSPGVYHLWFHTRVSIQREPDHTGARQCTADGMYWAREADGARGPACRFETACTVLESAP